MRWSEVALSVAAICCVGGVVYAWKNRVPSNPDAARKELVAQEPERTKCKENLAAFHKAWSAYCKDHKGSEPPSVDVLFPKYLKDTSVLVCPTATRWMGKKFNVARGGVLVGGKTVDATYGFKWLTGGAVHAKKLLGDAAPLVVCPTHTETLYIAAYKKKQPVGLYTGERRDSLIPEVKDAKDLAVLRNGTVKDIDPADE